MGQGYGCRLFPVMAFPDAVDLLPLHADPEELADRPLRWG